MNAFLLVGVGGALGAMARYGAGLVIGRTVVTSFPVATFLVNVLGSVAMGLFFGLIARFMPEWHADARLFVGVGILGGFTTFSAFSLDTITLMERGALAQAALYVGLSVVVCLGGLYLGLLVSRGGTV